MPNSLNSEINILESKLKILVSKLNQLESDNERIQEEHSQLEVSIAIKNYQLKKQKNTEFNLTENDTDKKINNNIKEKIDSTIIEIDELIKSLI